MNKLYEYLIEEKILSEKDILEMTENEILEVFAMTIVMKGHTEHIIKAYEKNRKKGLGIK